ncbi:ferritin, heavy subunit-like [Liolophura sinensis]|uniref:ferritin, heavy subunit-like n=1 Tax=Liolophura sinensis TaxID=3198878 RepID=UPI0031596526
MSRLIFLALLAFVRGDNVVRVNFHEDCEGHVNDLIQLNLAATFQYIAKAFHFREYDSEYAGMAAMFHAHAREKLNDAKHLMKYLIHRGAEVHWEDIPKPPNTNWSHPSVVMTQALEIEKNMLNKIIATHTCAQEHNDPDLMHDMANRMIIEEENTIFELGSYISHLAHDGAEDTVVLPHLSEKLFLKYKGYKDCFHAVEPDEYHNHPHDY